MRFFTLVALICEVLFAARYYSYLLNDTEWDFIKIRSALNSLVLHVILATTCGWLVLGGL